MEIFQLQLPHLDYNTLSSEREEIIDKKADNFFKKLSLNSHNTSRNFGRQSLDISNVTGSNSSRRHTEEHFEVKKKRQIHVKNDIPTGMIKFNNKSEH